MSSPVLHWERIHESSTDVKSFSWRAKVFGGWLIRSIINTRTIEHSEHMRGRRTELEVENVTMTFISDPMHVWDTVDKLLMES